jgi:hypothetical protein
MLPTMELWQAALRRRLFACLTHALMAQRVKKAGELIFVNVWRAGATRIVAKVSLQL